MAKRARKTTRKTNRKARKPAKRCSPPANGRGLARLVWATAGALAVSVMALGAILFFGPDAREPRPSPPVATIQVPAEELPAPTAPAPPTQTRPRPEPQVAAALQPAPAWRQHAMPATAAPGQPMIAIVIDDMGLDRARSNRTVDLPAPLTLAYLAYASDLATQTHDARTAGHELLVHVPMQPGHGADPGPNAVLLGLDPAELDRRMAWNLSRFDNFVGINNHMGSQATADRPAMAKVMTMLRERGLLFLDSRTSGATVAQAEAEKQGIPALRRDVFLDHDPSPIAVRSALLDVEEVARRQGHAVAIGHPKDATIDALAEWLPDARARGFALVPVSAVAARLAAPSQ